MATYGTGVKNVKGMLVNGVFQTIRGVGNVIGVRQTHIGFSYSSRNREKSAHPFKGSGVRNTKPGWGSRFIAGIAALAAALSFFSPFHQAYADETITVYIDFEGYNLGQGFYIEPTALVVDVGTTAAQAMETLLNQNNKTFKGGQRDNYLSAVAGFDKGAETLNIPAYITSNGGPTTDMAKTYGNLDTYLGEFDYSEQAGWIYTVNHEMGNQGISEKVLQAEDVVRFQFTLWGFGADLGLESWGAGVATPYYTHIDKSALIRALFAPGVPVAAKPAALSRIINPLASADEVANALAALAPVVDKTALNAAIAAATALKQAAYTTGSWAALNTELTAAKGVVANVSATWAEINTALTALNSAVAALEAVPLYTITSNTVTITQGTAVTLTLTGEVEYPLGFAVSASWISITGRSLEYTSTIPGLSKISTTLPNILKAEWPDSTAPIFNFSIPSDAAPGVYKLSDPTYTRTELIMNGSRPQGFSRSPETISSAPQEITITVLGYGDPGGLLDLLTYANGLSASDYTFTSWAVLQANRTVAQSALDNPASTQGELDTAKTNLQTAVDNLQLLSNATTDKAALTALITAAAALIEDDYVADGTWSTMQLKLGAGALIVNNETATPEQITAAYHELTAALAALKDKTTWVVTFTLADRDAAELQFFRTAGFDDAGYDIAGDPVAATATTKNGKTEYSLTLRDGTYSVRGTTELFAADGLGTKVATDIGGTYFSVPSAKAILANKIDSISLYIDSVYVNQTLNDEMLTAGSDYTIAIKDSSKRAVRIGGIHRLDATATGRTAYAVAALSRFQANGYPITITPSESLSAYFLETTVTNPYGSGVQVQVEMSRIYTLTIPATATFQCYTQATYYVNQPCDALTPRDNGDGTKSYSFFGDAPRGPNFIWRVSQPGKVTKAGWGLDELGTVVTFDDDENPNDPVTTMQPDRDGNSLLMNIVGGSNHLQLNVGATFKLRVFRAWEIINSDWQNKMIEPDFHYRFLEGADVLTLTPHDEINSNWVDLKAVKAGTAIIEVSYDGIDVFGSTYIAPEGPDGYFGASNPERKGIVVVTVGATAEKDFVLRVKKPDNTSFTNWDAEFDTWFFVGGSKEIEIQPGHSSSSVTTPDATITAWNPDVYGSLQTVSDGLLTIYPGNNIVKVEYEGKTNYWVIRGGSVRIVSDVTDRELTVGDSVRVLYGGANPAYPVPKMSGIYNPQNYGKLKEYDDAIILTQAMISGATSLRAGGSIADAHLGQPAGTHRSADYDNGLKIDMNAGGNEASFAVLPNVYFSDMLIIDRVALDSTIAWANDLTAADYTLASWEGLTGALSAALEVADNDSASQAEIDAAANALKAVINALVTPVDETPVPLPTLEAVRAVFKDVADYENAQIDALKFGYESEWVVLGLARGGELSSELRAAYLENLEADIVPILEENNGVLSSTKYTEHSRVILALTALGVNATDFAGYDLTAALANFNGSVRQGINGAIFALIALDSGDYEMPVLPNGSTLLQASRDSYINYILEREVGKGTVEAGGWSLSGSADPDITAMVLQALAPYYLGARSTQYQAEVVASVDRALARLSALQDDEACFTSWGDQNLESTAQVLVALSTLHVPVNDARFVKEGVTLFDAVLGFFDATSGGFKHVKNGAVNGMATEQAAYALVALIRHLADMPGLYDMTDADVPDSGDSGDSDGSDGSDGGPADYGTASADWAADSGAALTIRFDVEFSKFMQITLNGVPVDPANYDAVAGSTIVTLHADYLATLPVGTHTFVVEFVDGVAQFSANILESLTEQTPHSETGGRLVTNNMASSLAGMLLLLGAMLGGTAMAKRKFW
ncbi:MAG: FIVAR domain-containing protein [Propionibacteriaceae bacterium]|jgi:hypothetical protein|nr:FIVAR domain-containing protein [Propionibacteriaceae bacterium]